MPVVASYPGGLAQAVSVTDGAPSQDTVLVYKNQALLPVMLQSLDLEVDCPPSGASTEALFLRWKADTGAVVYQLGVFNGFPQAGGTIFLSLALEGPFSDTTPLVLFPPPTTSLWNMALPGIVLEHGWSVDMFMHDIQAGTAMTHIEASIVNLDGGQDALTSEVPVYLVPEPAGVL